MCSININDPLPTIGNREELYQLLSDREFKIPNKGDWITVINLNHTTHVTTQSGGFDVTISYLNGQVAWSIGAGVKAFSLVHLPSVDRWVFYNLKENKPISKLLSYQDAMKKTIAICIKVGRKPTDAMYYKAGLTPPPVKKITPPKIPVVAPRPGPTRTIIKERFAVRNKNSPAPVIKNLNEINKN